MSKIQISIKSIMNDLENGLTRLEKDNFGNGSIEMKYGLTKAEITDIFKNKKLKGLKVKGKKRKENRVDIIDDVAEIESSLNDMVDSPNVNMDDLADHYNNDSSLNQTQPVKAW